MSPVEAVPTEGAGFYRFCDVPVGWEYRWSPDGIWHIKDPIHNGSDSDLCEAREVLVAVMLPKWYVQKWARDTVDWAPGSSGDVARGAAKKALEALS